MNDLIDSDLPVTEEYVRKDDAAGHYNLEKLPSDAEDLIRIVKVGDYDACPCIGAHVAATKEIGRFGISSTGFENGVLRIRFKLYQG